MYQTLNTLYRNVLLPPVRYVTRNDAEVAHNWFNATMRWLSQHDHARRKLMPEDIVRSDRLKQTLMDGLEFANPFGIAAGMDKCGDLYPALFALTGVSHIEIGAFTPRAQTGNERPRLVRVGKDNLINAMGFPNPGVDAGATNLARLDFPKGILGGQITINKGTSDEEAPDAFAEVLKKLRVTKHTRVLPDYYSLNVSSPNTPGLRAWQEPSALRRILEAVCAELDQRTDLCTRPRRRLILKFAPDITHEHLEALIALVLELDLGGLTLTNTTLERPVPSRFSARPGGFSGSALYDKSASLVRFAASRLPIDRLLIACGGIDTADRAYEMLRYADLVQGYTGLALKGPFLFRTIAEHVTRRMEIEGHANLRELRVENRPRH